MTRAELEARFSRLLATEGPALSRLAGTYARAAGDREDLFQDIAMAIWRALPSFRGECSERTFLFRIAHNRGIAHIARRRLPTTDTDRPVEIEDGRPNPETSLSGKQQARQLVEAIRQLPLSYRQVVTLVLEDMSYADIAEVLGISESNVGARLTRARQMLRDLLQEQP